MLFGLRTFCVNRHRTLILFFALQPTFNRISYEHHCIELPLKRGTNCLKNKHKNSKLVKPHARYPIWRWDRKMSVSVMLAPRALAPSTGRHAEIEKIKATARKAAQRVLQDTKPGKNKKLPLAKMRYAVAEALCYNPSRVWIGEEDLHLGKPVIYIDSNIEILL